MLKDNAIEGVCIWSTVLFSYDPVFVATLIQPRQIFDGFEPMLTSPKGVHSSAVILAQDIIYYEPCQGIGCYVREPYILLQYVVKNKNLKLTLVLTALNSFEV